MSDLEIRIRSRGGRMRIPRSRGAITGGVLTLLGLWGAAAPFIGPHVDFVSTGTESGTWTAAVGWLQVLPGVATAVSGLLLLASRNRAVAMLAAWIAVLGGLWFVVGRRVYDMLGFGNPSATVPAGDVNGAWADLALFIGLGALIVFIAAASLGRLSVRSVRDIRTAESPVGFTEAAPAQPVAPRDPNPQTTAEAVPGTGGDHTRRGPLANLFGRTRSSTTASRE